MNARSISTLAQLPALNAREHGDVNALSFEGRVTTYAEFDAHVNQVANALLAMGLKKDDRIAHLGKNSDRYFELLFGAMKAGVVLAPVGWRLAEPEIAHILANSEARVLFVEEAFFETGFNAASQSGGIERFVVMDGRIDGHMAYPEMRDAQSVAAPDVAVEPGDVAVQIYTSGTTGMPKGTMLSHASFITMRDLRTASGSEAGKYLPGDISLLAMPVSHVGGTATGLWAMYYGIASVVARQFDPDDVLDFIARDGVNNFFLVPSALQRIVRDPRAKTVDFSRLRYIVYGGSPMPRDLLAECIAVFKCGFVQGYGMTETCATIVELSPQDHDPADPTRLRSCGKPLPGVEIAIRDGSGAPLPQGQIGEIVTRSPGNMLGYWRDPQATARTIDANGWLRTGDAGYIDADGYLFIHDRIKDMIVSGGENIYPAEVENAIFGHPGVAEVAVIGVPSERWGEEVKAMIVRRPATQASADEIIAWARERLAGFKIPKSIEFLEALPKSGAGKILKRELRAPYWAGRDRLVN